MFKQIKSIFSPYTILIVANIILGVNSVAIKAASEYIDPIYLASIRYTVMGLFLGLIFHKHVRNLKFAQAKPLLVNALILIAYAALFFVGIEKTTALKAGIIFLLTPLVVYLMSITLLKEPFVKKALLGSLIGLTGSLVIIGAPILTAGSVNIGDLLLFLSAVALASSMIHTKHIYKYCSVEQVMTMQPLLTGIVFLIYAGTSGTVSNFIDIPLGAILWLFYLVFPGSILGLLMYSASLKKLRAEDTAPIYYLNPLSTTVVAATVLMESLVLTDYIGAAVILLGVAMAHPYHHHKFHRLHLPNISKSVAALVMSSLKRIKYPSS